MISLGTNVPTIGTALAYCADTLNAPVEILDQPKLAGTDFTEVRTLPGGVGGWSVAGKVLVVRTNILRDITLTNPDAAPVDPQPVPDEPAPLDHTITGDEYIEVLLARQAHHIATHHGDPHFPPLLEWFVRAEDEPWVILPEAKPQPKRTPKPRTYRTAESLRTELANVQRQMNQITGADGEPDRAVANLSPNARSKAAARAGRRRFVKLDRDLERYAKLATRADRLAGRLALAEAREAQAGRSS